MGKKKEHSPSSLGSLVLWQRYYMLIKGVIFD